MIAIVTDSTAYFTKAQANTLGVSIVPINYSIGGQNYSENFTDQNGPYEQMLLKNSTHSHTAQASSGAFASAFNELLQQGHKVLCIVLSSRLSGTYSSASIAARDIGSPDIMVVDSLTTAGGLILLAEKARELINEGGTLASVAAALEKVRSNMGIVFSVDNMDALRRSGRLGTVRQSVGTILNVRPILLLKDGSIVSDGQARGKNAQSIAIAERIPTDAKKIILHYFSNISNLDDLRIEVKKHVPLAAVGYCRCGPVLGVHLGLGTIGVSWMK